MLGTLAQVFIPRSHPVQFLPSSFYFLSSTVPLFRLECHTNVQPFEAWPSVVSAVLLKGLPLAFVFGFISFVMLHSRDLPPLRLQVGADYPSLPFVLVKNPCLKNPQCVEEEGFAQISYSILDCYCSVSEAMCNYLSLSGPQKETPHYKVDLSLLQQIMENECLDSVKLDIQYRDHPEVADLLRQLKLYPTIKDATSTHTIPKPITGPPQVDNISNAPIRGLLLCDAISRLILNGTILRIEKSMSPTPVISRATT